MDVLLWPSESNGGISLGDAQVAEMLDLFKDLLEQNGCDMGMALTEWDTLEIYVQPLILNNEEDDYVSIWKRIFTNVLVKKECKIVLHVIEILLINSHHAIYKCQGGKNVFTHEPGKERLENETPTRHLG